MAVLDKIKRALRGEVELSTAAREAWRRSFVSLEQRKERAKIANYTKRPADVWQRLPAADWLRHFQSDRDVKFFAGFTDRASADFYRAQFPKQAAEMIASADRIVDEHRWPLLGFGERDFGKQIEWTRDPLSGYVWPLDYHADINLMRDDGSDARVLWELNRLGHTVTLARAYFITQDERYTAEFFSQLRSWDEQNPYGRGANWTCAMEVALRVMNLIAAFHVFRHSPRFDYDSLEFLLRLFQEHGNYICDHLEFSHIATSNHFLSDVAGLVWLGEYLPEFRDCEYWSNLGFVDMLEEMDKQVLADGADYEASTGYHRFVLELFLYSFVLCRLNENEIEQKSWDKLHQMLVYVRSYLRPDGFAPLIGDTDSGQVLPVQQRRADDHAYVLAIGAVVFKDPGLKLAGVEPPEELFWILGEEGVRTFQEMSSSDRYAGSTAFPNAGTYIMRNRDLYLCFNASGAGINGRGSHGHNDVLSIEVSAGGRAFIVDPGTYVYSADLAKRHEFRSTAYHSTVQIDGLEQNTIAVQTPFVIGNEANPRVLEWQTGDDFDKVVGEHHGYPVTHRRTVTFDKRQRCWLIDDEFIGEGEHVFEARFHFAPGLDVGVNGATVEAGDLVVTLLNSDIQPVLESKSLSHDYGQISDSISACWRVSGRVSRLSWKISFTGLQDLQD
ncbi:MAG TPA: alginate lyase family protein [Pyrinomonadaceae bacterium]|nr:alginate lyase family protein [Pyrinomonadaceae bacterium]